MLNDGGAWTERGLRGVGGTGRVGDGAGPGLAWAGKGMFTMLSRSRGRFEGTEGASRGSWVEGLTSRLSRSFGRAGTGGGSRGPWAEGLVSRSPSLSLGRTGIGGGSRALGPEGLGSRSLRLSSRSLGRAGTGGASRAPTVEGLASRSLDLSLGRVGGTGGGSRAPVMVEGLTSRNRPGFGAGAGAPGTGDAVREAEGERTSVLFKFSNLARSEETGR